MRNFNKNFRKKVTSIVASLALAGGLSASNSTSCYSMEVIGALIGGGIGVIPLVLNSVISRDSLDGTGRTIFNIANIISASQLLPISGALIGHLISTSSKKSAETANYEEAITAKRSKLENSASTLLSNVIKIETLIENENLKCKSGSEAMKSLKILKDEVAEYYPGFMKTFNGLLAYRFIKTYDALVENLKSYIKSNLSADQFSDLTSKIDIANKDCAVLLSSLEAEIVSASKSSQNISNTL